MSRGDTVRTHNGVLCRHKKNDILSFATTWMDLKGITQSEIRQINSV